MPIATRPRPRRQLKKITAPPPMLGTAIQRECLRHFGIRGNPQAVMFSIPNGGLRDAKNAATLKGEGLQPGVPDTFAKAPSNGGIWIEFKGKNEPLLESQKAYFPVMEAAGCAVFIVRELGEALRLLEFYGILNGRAS